MRISLKLGFLISIFFGKPAFAHTDSVRTKKRIVTQYNNSIILSGTDYTLFSKTYFQRRGILGPLLFVTDEQIGVYYKRKLSEKWSATIGAGKWNNTPLYYESPGMFTSSQSRTIREGIIITSAKYKMIDGFVNYRMAKTGRQAFNAGVGLSYTRGLNEIVDSIVVINGSFLHSEVFSHSEKATYFGIVPAVSYDYLILRNRLSVGVDIRYRHYFGFYHNAPEGGCHLGVNF